MQIEPKVLYALAWLCHGTRELRAQVTALMYICRCVFLGMGVYCAVRSGCSGQALLTAVGSICNASNLLLSVERDELMCLSAVCFPVPVIPPVH